MKSYTCFIKKEGKQYASLCVELDVASCGSTEQEALDGLKDAIETYLDFMRDEGKADEILRPIPLDELRDFLFTEPRKSRYAINAIPLELEYA